MAQVEARCGPPTTREDVTETYCGENYCHQYKSGERWTYDDGPYDLIKILLFRNGLLFQVDRGGYGSEPKKKRSISRRQARLTSERRAHNLQQANRMPRAGSQPRRGFGEGRTPAASG